MNKLMKVSCNFRKLFQFLLILYPLATLITWIFMDKFSLDFIATNTGFSSFQAQEFLFTPLSKFLGCLISLVTTGIIMYGISQFISLFKNYEKNLVFTLQNVEIYRKLGKMLFVFVIASILSKPFMSLALTFQNPPHHKMISLSFGSNDISLLIVGGLILIISWVMQEAYQISEENAQTI